MRHHIPLVLAAAAVASCQAAPLQPALEAPAAARALYRVAAAGPAAATPIVTAPAASRRGLAVTIYNDDLGLVADTRDVTLAPGALTLRFTEMARQIDATSLHLEDPKGGLTVREQIYAFDVLTPQKLLEAYVGKTVRFRLPAEGDRPGRIVEAELVSAEGGLILKIDGGVEVNPKGDVILPEVPEGFRVSPTLEWLLEVATGGTRALTGSYQTRGIGWQADYTLTLEEGSDQADLEGWAAITNRSGADYPDAAITLVAGDLSRVNKPPVPMPLMAPAGERMVVSDQFQEQPLAEFHSYHLGRKATIEDEQTKQLRLLGAEGLTIARRYAFDAQRASQSDKPSPVAVSVRFENTEANRLGVPLPRGTVRMIQSDAEGRRAVVGEDRIDHTPVGETVEVAMGQAFDVTGTRTQTKFERIGDKAREEGWKIQLSNQKATPVTVEVVERLYGDWKILESSMPYIRKSATEVVFSVPVPAKGEATVTYTARFEP